MTSIRSHLTVRLLLGFVLILSFASILVYFIARKILVSDFDARLFARAQAAIASISQQGDKVDIDWSDLPQGLNPKTKHADLIQVLDASGHSLGGDPALTADLATGINRYGDVVLPHRGKFRFLTIAFVPHVETDDVVATPATPANLVHTCTLMVATERVHLDRSLIRLAIVLALMTVLTSLSSVAVVVLALRKGLSPLLKLSSEVADIDASSLQTRVEGDALPTELMPIAEKLNDLLGRLEVSFAREKQFSADVSHELRTPIAELRSLAEVMLSFPESSPETRQAFEDTLEAARQMESIVTVLLEIVRNEQNPGNLPLSRLNLPELVQAVWQNFEKKAGEKSLQVTLPVPEKDGWIETEPRLLKIILTNLFSNAVEYAPENGQLAIGLKIEEGAASLTVANSVATFAHSDLPHLFERFWRKDRIRGATEHFGLGLPLAKTLSDRLKLRLTASMEGGAILVFLLRFPVLSEAEVE